MNVDDDDLRNAQRLAYALNDLFVGCTPAAICTAIGTVLACADCEDEEVRDYVGQIAVVAGMVRARNNEEEVEAEEQGEYDNVIPFHRH